jgi:hypothetical protein
MAGAYFRARGLKKAWDRRSIAAAVSASTTALVGAFIMRRADMRPPLVLWAASVRIPEIDACKNENFATAVARSRRAPPLPFVGDAQPEA